MSIDASVNTNELERKLNVLSSGLGNILNELLKTVGEDMSSDAKSKALTAFNNRTGKLQSSINFILTKDNIGALTTRKTLNKSNAWYAKFVEYGANINAKRKEYLVFKINGEWKKVKSVRVRPRPFMVPVWEDYWNSETSKGYQKLQEALMRKIEGELDV
jgi:hypothetical protein